METNRETERESAERMKRACEGEISGKEIEGEKKKKRMERNKERK